MDSIHPQSSPRLGAAISLASANPACRLESVIPCHLNSIQGHWNYIRVNPLATQVLSETVAEAVWGYVDIFVQLCYLLAQPLRIVVNGADALQSPFAPKVNITICIWDILGKLIIHMLLLFLCVAISVSCLGRQQKQQNRACTVFLQQFNLKKILHPPQIKQALKR